MRKSLFFLIIAALLAASIFCPAVSARYADNTGINPGDTVFIGEQGLDFSKFSTPTLTVDSMVMQSGGSITDMFTVTNGIGNIGTSVKPGIYMPYNGTTPLNTGMCKVVTIDSVIGSLAVSSADGISISSSQPSDIPKGVGVIFSVIGGDISTLESQLTGDWNRMILKNTETSLTTSVITNLAGTAKSLSGIKKPSNPGSSYAFKLGEQPAVVSATGTTPLEMTFQISVNGITAETKYRFSATSSSLQLTVPSELPLDGTGTVIFTGVPGSTYEITLQKGPKFVDTGDGKVIFVNNYTLHITPGWDGTVSLALQAPENIKLGSYTITAVNIADPTETTTNSVVVGASKMKLRFNSLFGDTQTGILPIGESITFGGTIESAPMQSVPIYLFLTGRGLPENGVNLLGEPLVDGDSTSFTIAYYNPQLDLWSFSWSTSNKFDTGTYTIHANLKPYGFIQSSTPGTEAYVDHISYDLSLTDISIHAKFSEANNGLFAQGDYLYSYWVARGAPNSVRWYIVGTNYLWSGLEKDLPNYVGDDKQGLSVSKGEYGFTYPRNFTMEIDPGNYYLIYQHPGVDGIFNVYPDVDNGEFSVLRTTFGESANVGTMPRENAAYTLQELISKSLSDDYYVVSEFTIEEPYIHITQEDTIEIGTPLVIQGITNYAASEFSADKTDVGNTLSLLINRIDFELTEENAAMALKIVPRVEPEKTVPYDGERPFIFDEIDTSTWFEGTYEAVVTNINTGFSSSMIFNVVGEGVVQDSTTLPVPANPLETPLPLSNEVPVLEDITIPEQIEPPVSSPGFAAVPFALLLAGWFALHRREQ